MKRVTIQLDQCVNYQDTLRRAIWQQLQKAGAQICLEQVEADEPSKGRSRIPCTEPTVRITFDDTTLEENRSILRTIGPIISRVMVDHLTAFANIYHCSEGSRVVIPQVGYDHRFPNFPA